MYKQLLVAGYSDETKHSDSKMAALSSQPNCSSSTEVEKVFDFSKNGPIEHAP